MGSVCINIANFNFMNKVSSYPLGFLSRTEWILYFGLINVRMLILQAYTNTVPP